MRTSRPSLVVAAASVLVLAGCGAGEEQTGTVQRFCDDYAEFSQAEFLDGVDTTDVSSVLTALDAMVQQARQIHPPAEIAEAWTTVFQASEDQVLVMRGVDWSSESAQQEYLDSVQGFRSEELDAATAEVEGFVAESCPS